LTDPDGDVDIEVEIAANVLVLDVEPIPDLGDAPPNEPEEGYLEAPEWLR